MNPMYCYAQINTDNICYSVIKAAGEIIEPDMIPIDSFDESLLSKHWTGSTWETVITQD